MAKPSIAGAPATPACIVNSPAKHQLDEAKR